MIARSISSPNFASYLSFIGKGLGLSRGSLMVLVTMMSIGVGRGVVISRVVVMVWFRIAILPCQRTVRHLIRGTKVIGLRVEGETLGGD
jgi:hypothetical protein